MGSRLMTLDAAELEAVSLQLLQTSQRAANLFDAQSNVHMRAACAAMVADVEDFRSHLPLVSALLHPGMRPRHWEELNASIAAAAAASDDQRRSLLDSILSSPTLVQRGNFHTQPQSRKQQQRALMMSPASPLSLSEALADDWEMYADVVVAVSAKAAREHAIELALNDMQDHWSRVYFDVTPHVASGSYVLNGVSELIDTLDEHAVATQTLLMSQYRAPLEDRLRKWSRVLARTGDVLEEWMHVQRAWLRLWPLFDAPDLVTTLPNEAAMFASVHKHWSRTLMAVKRGKRGCCHRLVRQSRPALSCSWVASLTRHVYACRHVCATQAMRVCCQKLLPALLLWLPLRPPRRFSVRRRLAASGVTLSSSSALP
jgi:hypothetical protein